MKTLWKSLSVVCVMNVIAFVAVVAWLLMSGRLTVERARTIQAMFSTTEAEAAAMAAEAAAAQEGELAEVMARERESNPPPSSAVQVADRSNQRQIELGRARRLESDLQALRRQLEDGQQVLANERAAFDAERRAWDEHRRNMAALASDEQFQRVVKLLENVPASQAKDTLVGLMGSGSVEDAVAYLNAMKPFSAAKVLKAFKGEELQLATELLQRMKALGHEVEAAGTALDADDAASAG